MLARQSARNSVDAQALVSVTVVMVTEVIDAPPGGATTKAPTTVTVARMETDAGPQAPGELELVRAFVNTLDVEDGVEALAGPADLDAWARERGCPAPEAAAADLARVLELREALRSLLLAHHDGAAADVEALGVVDDAMSWGVVRPSLAAGGLTWRAADLGVSGLVGRLMSAVSAAVVDGTWSRLKVCGNDTCRWAFYDHSRSRTGRWCSMKVCGNRAKQQKFKQALRD